MKRYSIRVTPVVALTFVACAPVSKPWAEVGSATVPQQASNTKG